MHVLFQRVDLRIEDASSLKAKRSVVQSIVRTLDGWKAVGAAEVDALDLWQRAVLGITIVGGSPGHVDEVADSVERFIWSAAGIEVISIERAWADTSQWERV